MIKRSPHMPTRTTPPLRKPAQIVTAVVQPMTKRLARLEAILLEMQYEQDVQTRRIHALRAQIEALSDMHSLGRVPRGKATAIPN
jgi:hypothetical protein